MKFILLFLFIFVITSNGMDIPVAQVALPRSTIDDFKVARLVANEKIKEEKRLVDAKLQFEAVKAEDEARLRRDQHRAEEARRTREGEEHQKRVHAEWATRNPEAAQAKEEEETRRRESRVREERDTREQMTRLELQKRESIARVEHEKKESDARVEKLLFAERLSVWKENLKVTGYVCIGVGASLIYYSNL